VGGEPQMTEQTFLLVCVVAILFYIGWKFDQNKKHKEKLRLERERLTDGAVIQAQTEFEKRLEANVLLPDGIWRKEAFIYWQLMRKWFASLLASSRYGGSSDKIKSDWLQYMHLMEERAMYVFLSSEAPDEEASKAPDQGADEAHRKLQMIEDAMAAAVGQEAVKQLEEVRSRPDDAFDHTGLKPMAPVGYHYWSTPNSKRPYDEELVPD
jgi:hypothetical protein